MQKSAKIRLISFIRVPKMSKANNTLPISYQSQFSEKIRLNPRFAKGKSVSSAFQKWAKRIIRSQLVISHSRSFQKNPFESVFCKSKFVLSAFQNHEQSEWFKHSQQNLITFWVKIETHIINNPQNFSVT